MCNKYLLTEGDISRCEKVKLDNIQDFIRNQIDVESDFVKIVNDNFWELGQFGDTDNSKDETFNVTEEQSRQLCDFKKPLYHKCEKCGNQMYANMKFGVVELECQTCGNYTEI